MKCALSCISQGDSYHWNRYECNQNPSHTHFNIIYQHQDSDIYIIYTIAASSWELNNKIFLYHCNELLRLRLISRNTNYNYNTIELSKLPKIIFGSLQKRGNYTNWIKSLAQLKLTVFENDALWSTIETLFFYLFSILMLIPLLEVGLILGCVLVAGVMMSADIYTGLVTTSCPC